MRKRAGASRYLTLHPWQTLGSAGVVENEVLVLCYFIQPGAKTQAADLQKRLAQEYNWLKELAAKSPLIDVEPVEGDPPTKYRVSFKCKGMMLNPISGKPTLTANHVMEIYLPAGIPGYPNEAPYVLCLTPHFHPNISSENNMVCVGIERDWENSLDVAWLVTHLADMITYRVYGFEKPYNQKAVKWTKANKARLPLDNRHLFQKETAVAKPSKGGKESDVLFEKPLAVAKVATRLARPTTAKRITVKATAKKTIIKSKQLKRQPIKSKSVKRSTARSKRK
jgi:ubiquitin-protein ligase